MVTVFKVSRESKRTNDCAVDGCNRLSKGPNFRDRCQKHYSDMFRDLSNFGNEEPRILPPAKKPRRSTKVNGNLNDFEYDDDQVKEILKEAGEGDVPHHITGIPVSGKKMYYFFKVYRHGVMNLGSTLDTMVIFGMYTHSIPLRRQRSIMLMPRSYWV
jgi:hypothetical protein